MTPRSIRRLAERRANKLARKAAQQGAIATENQIPGADGEPPAETQSEPTAPTIIPAAAANAYLSAVTSTLTGESTLLPTADATQYDQLLRDYQNEFQPVGLQESELVQTLAETIWRTRRLRALESAIFAKGRIEFAAQFAEHNPELRLPLIDVHTFLTYEKQIRGLQTQEARLSRRADKASTELRILQKERHQREEEARRKQHEKQQRKPQAAIESEPNGFEFSNHEIEPHPTQTQPAKTNFSDSNNFQKRAEAA
jgi:pterin-4a-carbinolamine dehydratase